MGCNHNFELVPPHKYRPAYYTCEHCDMDLTLEEHESMQHFYNAGRQQGLEDAAEVANNYVATHDSESIYRTKQNIRTEIRMLKAREVS